MSEKNQTSPKINLLWLHGWGQNKELLKPLANFFEKQYNNYFLDLPGFGDNSPPPEAWDTKQYADYVSGWLEEQKISQAVVIGHSFGGKVSMQMAVHHPDKVQSIVLLAASGVKRKRSVRFKIRAFCLRMMARLADLIDSLFGTRLKKAYSNRFGSRDYRAAQGVMRSILVKSVNEDLRDVVTQISQPALLVYGEKDGEAPPEVGQILHRAIRGSTYLELPGQSHYSLLGTGRHQVQNHITCFLKDHL